MDLREYLFRQRIKLIDFAETTGLSKAYLCSIKNGNQYPSLSLRKLIQYATDDVVHHDTDWERKNEN